MATAKRDLTNPPVQGHTVHPLDKMIAIAVRIAEREGLLLESTPSPATATDEPDQFAADNAGDKDRATA